MKSKRAKIIKELFDELRSDIVVKNEFQLLRLEYLKRMELNAIEENSDEAVERIRKYVEKKKQDISEYPALRLRSQWINGKFVVTKL